jgi:cytochrome c553
MLCGVGRCAKFDQTAQSLINAALLAISFNEQQECPSDLPPLCCIFRCLLAGMIAAVIRIGEKAMTDLSPRAVIMTRISGLNTAAAVVAAAIVSLAWTAPVWPQGGKRPADANRGAVIAAQGAAGAPACAACHAFDGSADTTGAFPRIDGQSASYLEQQMRDFASSDRMNAIMSPIAKALSADDIADVAEYYANKSSQFLPLATADAAIVKRGQQLAQEGDAAKGILGCNNCHGPDGVGMPPMPYLAGQYAQYTVFTLHMWKGGFRKNSPDMMAPIAKQLDDREIAAVAAYYQQVRRPAGAAASK